MDQRVLPGRQAIPGLAELGERLEKIPQTWLPHIDELTTWLERWVAALDAYDIDTMVELVTPDIVWEDPGMLGETVHGPEEFRAFTELSLEAFPDLRFEAVDAPYLASDGLGFAVPWRISGTFTGKLSWWGKGFGSKPPVLSPTGRTVDVEGIDLYEFRDGRLSRWVVLYDLLEVSVQLGLTPDPHSRLVRGALLGQRLMAPLLRRRAAG